MTYMKQFQYIFIPVLIVLMSNHIYSAKLAEVLIVDQNYVMVRLMDGEVTHRDDGIGPNAFTSNYHEDDIDTVKMYTPALNTSAAQQVSNWTVKSADDPAFGVAGVNPAQCFRKTKLNGHAEKEWQGSDFRYESTYEHTIYLEFTQTLKQGSTYTLEITGAVNADSTTHTFTYDIFTSVSEAVHVNLAGYHPDPSMKSADLYIWMGDGGARDYSTFAGNKVYLYDTASQESTEVGSVVFWKESGNDVGWYNLIRSPVWNADFSGHTAPGTYRLAIEGVGCSREFIISENAYFNPFMVSTQGFFYMRIGQDSTGGISPVPRRPLFIPGVSPVNTKVYLTTMTPYHPEWTTFSGGDCWDRPDDWAPYRKSGNPVNDNAIGGHSDALDWDRRMQHVSIIWDMLLPYYLTNGVLKEDNLDITESGNGVPDILDEAQNEVDFWLSARDGAAYSHGLTNPNKDNEFFQAGTSTVAAWANAANAAMLADCFRISGNTALMNRYRDSAIVAYNYAGGQTDQMLDSTNYIGDGSIRGRDLKMMAAASLYNITGQTTWEEVVNEESIITGPNSALVDGNTKNQLWGTAIYLKTSRAINYPTLHANMKASVIAQAKSKEVDLSTSRPSRRSTPNQAGYFRTAQNVHHSIIAHAVADQQADKTLFLKALVLEADYGLGRNPMNMIQMTTASTPLESMRSVQCAYTSGHDDGSPGMHPGHTPYFNLDDWNSGMVMGSPSKLYENCYPTDFKNTWPIDEGYFNTKYVWAHNEFTPQQTMRGKMALYGYLYGIHKNIVVSISHFFKEKPFNSQLYKGNTSILKIRVFDIKGRTLWTSNKNINIKSMYKHMPSSGLYFIERTMRSGNKIRYSVIKL